MAGLDFIGSYSGIDKATIDKLMAAEKRPLIQLASRQTSITGKQNAWKDVNTRLNTLFEKMKALQNKDTFTAKSSTSSNDKNVSMTVGNNAPAGSYKIKVDKLATSTSIVGGSVVGSLDNGGDFTITNANGEHLTISAKAGESLKDIAAKINDPGNEVKDKEGNITKKSVGVTATVIDNRLVLTNVDTGQKGIDLSGDALGGLGLKAITIKQSLDVNADNSDKAGVQIFAGTKAEFTVNGIKVENDSNSVSGVIEDITINLTKTHDDTNTNDYDTVTVSADNSKIIKAVQDFVDQFNSTMSFLDEKLAAGNPDVKDSRGALAGDSEVGGQRS